MRRRTRLSPSLVPVLLGALLALGGCERFPRDPRDTLEAALERGSLRVGVAASEPWVEGEEPARPGGVEAALVEAFAETLGIGIEWHWGSAGSRLEALARFELDLAIGGFTDDDPWGRHVGFTFPYHSVRFVVATPPAAAPVTALDGLRVAVRADSALAGRLRERGAEVSVAERLAEVELPIAAESWRVEGLGFEVADIELDMERHVMAVPPGENAMLLRLERFLLARTDAARLDESLWQASRR